MKGEAQSSGTAADRDAVPNGGGWRNALWAILAAFGTYFCMYAFRKPFTASTYAGQTAWGMDFKTLLVSAQVAGYTLSKFAGIRVVSEITPARRAAAILLLIAFAQAALLLFAVIPRPWNAVALFLNGLPLGMVFGLVLGFLEGRRATEAMTAGLCASFILADGVVKTVGAWLLSIGVSEWWMPGAAGALFVPPLLLGVWMLSRLPAPDAADVAARSARSTMTRRERWSLAHRYAAGLLLLTLMYLVLTIIRSVRADFAPELWRGLGEAAVPAVFSRTESLVAACVLVVLGSAALIRDNRRALLASLFLCVGGGVLLAGALLAREWGVIGAFGFMTLTGLGMYFPYAAMNTMVFERMLAATRERGTMGFLMYIVDSVGYLGFVGVIVFKASASPGGEMLDVFSAAGWIASVLCVVCGLGAAAYFAAKTRESAAVDLLQEARA
ncbi:MAG: hypothetical protein JNK25_11110 [Phycisphaerae bacterium]|nr:hypothetical protein [Phycisphaerae bacterium]